MSQQKYHKQQWIALFLWKEVGGGGDEDIEFKIEQIEISYLAYCHFKNNDKKL